MFTSDYIYDRINSYVLGVTDKIFFGHSVSGYKGKTMENTTFSVDKRDFIAFNLSQCRKAMQLSQEELAEKCDVSVDAIRSWERKRKNISSANIAKLSDALKCDFEKDYQQLCDYKYIANIPTLFEKYGLEVFIGYVGKPLDILQEIYDSPYYKEYGKDYTVQPEDALLYAYNRTLEAGIKFNYDYGKEIEYLFKDNPIISFISTPATSLELTNYLLFDVPLYGNALVVRKECRDIVFTNDDFLKLYEGLIEYGEVFARML